MNHKQQTEEGNNTKSIFILLGVGILLILAVMLFALFFNFTRVSDLCGWIIFVAMILVFFLGLFLWYLAMKKIIADTERVDESTYLKTAKDSGLNLENHYKEYCKTLNSKKKKKHAQNSESDSNSNDYKSYDNWYSDIRNAYRKSIEEERKKKKGDNSVRGFTPDMKHSLKNIKRRVAFRDELYKTVLLPAELGFIAIICTAGVIIGPRVFLFAIILTLFVCYICTKMLIVNRRIDNFVDDFVDAVEIDLENIHNIEEHLD